MSVRRFTILFVMVVLFSSGRLWAAPRIVFDKEVHDYGRVLFGETVVEEFKFRNEGDAPLIIEG
jgi:Protein of unknown function (DUF1573)